MVSSNKEFEFPFTDSFNTFRRLCSILQAKMERVEKSRKKILLFFPNSFCCLQPLKFVFGGAQTFRLGTTDLTEQCLLACQSYTFENTFPILLDKYNHVHRLHNCFIPLLTLCVCAGGSHWWVWLTWRSVWTGFRAAATSWSWCWKMWTARCCACHTTSTLWFTTAGNAAKT